MTKISNLICSDFEWDAIVLLAISELAARGQEDQLLSEMTPQNILRLALAAAARMLTAPEHPRLQPGLRDAQQSAPFQPRQRGGARPNTGNRHKTKAA